MTEADVEVSIVNHGNRELLRACLGDLPAACDGLRWHCTVIDNASHDGSVEMLGAEFPHVSVIANAVQAGFGANHNKVLRGLIDGGQARYALILNDDTRLEPGAVTNLVKQMDGDPQLGAVVPTILDAHGGVAASRIAYPTLRNAWHQDWWGRTEPPDPEQGWLQGCCLLIRIAALARVGLFDERYFLFYEDTDMSRRLSDRGWRLGVCESARVLHLGHVSVLKPELAEATPRLGLRSRDLYFQKYLGPRRARMISLGGRALLALRALKRLAGGRLRHEAHAVDDARKLWALAAFDPRRSSVPGVPSESLRQPAGMP